MQKVNGPAFLQGREVINLRKLHSYKRVVYCGDGANDLCPALSLLPGDIVLARRNGSLQDLLCKREAAQAAGTAMPDGRSLQAPVHWWSTHLELVALVQRFV